MLHFQEEMDKRGLTKSRRAFEFGYYCSIGKQESQVSEN